MNSNLKKFAATYTNFYMSIFNHPKWINRELLGVKTFNEINYNSLIDIKEKIKIINNNKPLISIVIPVYNEEVNLIRCIDSLVRSITKFPYEIIIINNNSTDNTQKVIAHFGLRYFNQPIQGYGPARQKGLEVAKGKYILTADADCLYPPTWIEYLTKLLIKKKALCVFGTYSYIAIEGYARWKLFVYEQFKEILSTLKIINRPYLNCYGMNMGFEKEAALNIGYDKRNIRGEDGRLCYDFMTKGKIYRFKSSKGKVWTTNLAYQKDGTFYSFYNKARKEINNLYYYLKKQHPHNTKISKNELND